MTLSSAKKRISEKKLQPGEKMREIRLALGLSIADFASRIKASHDRVTSWEAGRRKLQSWAIENIYRQFSSVNKDYLEGDSHEMFIEDRKNIPCLRCRTVAETATDEEKRKVLFHLLDAFEIVARRGIEQKNKKEKMQN